MNCVLRLSLQCENSDDREEKLPGAGVPIANCSTVQNSKCAERGEGVGVWNSKKLHGHRCDCAGRGGGRVAVVAVVVVTS